MRIGGYKIPTPGRGGMRRLLSGVISGGRGRGNADLRSSAANIPSSSGGPGRLTGYRSMPSLLTGGDDPYAQPYRPEDDPGAPPGTNHLYETPNETGGATGGGGSNDSHIYDLPPDAGGEGQTRMRRDSSSSSDSSDSGNTTTTSLSSESDPGEGPSGAASDKPQRVLLRRRGGFMRGQGGVASVPKHGGAGGGDSATRPKTRPGSTSPKPTQAAIVRTPSPVQQQASSEPVPQVFLQTAGEANPETGETSTQGKASGGFVYTPYQYHGSSVTTPGPVTHQSSSEPVILQQAQTSGELPKIVTHQAITSRVRGGPQQGKIDPSRVQHAEQEGGGDSGFPFGFFSSSQTPGEPSEEVTYQVAKARVRGGPQQGKIDPSRVQYAEHQDTGTGGSDGADSPLGNSWLKAMQEQRRSSSSSSSSSGSETDEGEGADSPLGNSWLKAMQEQRRGGSGSSGGGTDA